MPPGWGLAAEEQVLSQDIWYKDDCGAHVPGSSLFLGYGVRMYTRASRREAWRWGRVPDLISRCRVSYAPSRSIWISGGEVYDMSCSSEKDVCRDHIFFRYSIVTGSSFVSPSLSTPRPDAALCWLPFASQNYGDCISRAFIGLSSFGPGRPAWKPSTLSGPCKSSGFAFAGVLDLCPSSRSCHSIFPAHNLAAHAQVRVWVLDWRGINTLLSIVSPFGVIYYRCVSAGLELFLFLLPVRNMI